MSYKSRAAKRQKRRHQKRNRAAERAIARYLRAARSQQNRPLDEAGRRP